MNATPMLTPGWVYSFSDYQQMYHLTEVDCQKRILDFPGVVGSFNAEASQKGMQVQSAGAIYQLTPKEMDSHVKAFYSKHVAVLEAHSEWLKVDGDQRLTAVLKGWEKSAALFLDDYPKGREDGRYLPVDVAQLPFKPHQFDLALCTHMLFDHVLPEGISAIDLLHQLCIMAEEVRLYPLLDQQGKIADELGPLMLRLQEEHYGVEVREVAYQQQSGGNAMLRIWAHTCDIG